MSKARPFTTIKAGHFRVRFVWCDEAERENDYLDGWVNVSREVGGIYEGQTPASGSETLLHECMHIATALAGITDETMPDSEEKLVDLLSKAISGMIRNNKPQALALVECFSDRSKTFREAWDKRKKKRGAKPFSP